MKGFPLKINGIMHFTLKSMNFNWKCKDSNRKSMDFNWTSIDFNWKSIDLNWKSIDFNCKWIDFNWKSIDLNWKWKDFHWTFMNFNWKSIDFDWKCKAPPATPEVCRTSCCKPPRRDLFAAARHLCSSTPCQWRSSDAWATSGSRRTSMPTRRPSSLAP